MSLHTLLVSTLPLAGLGILWSLGSGPKAQTIAAEEGGKSMKGPPRTCVGKDPPQRRSNIGSRRCNIL